MNFVYKYHDIYCHLKSIGWIYTFKTESYRIDRNKFVKEPELII